MEILDLVKQQHNFNFDLKAEQRECITHLLNGKNVFGLLPTGFGKSLIYTLLPLILSQKTGVQKTSLVVSPLRTLMMDQVSTLQKKGIAAVALMKDFTPDDMKAIKSGTVDVLFISPEMMVGHKVDMIKHLINQICALVFDECHCISEWGLDFRPDYRKVADIVSMFSNVPTLLLTATATPKIQTDLYDLLALNDDTVVVAKLPDRPNVYIHVEKPPIRENIEEKLHWLLDVVQSHQEQSPKTVVYCRNLRVCETLYMWIMEELGERAYVRGEETTSARMVEMYHSRTDSESMDRILTNFKKPDSNVRIICATVAFGLGVDIPDIEVVVNWGVPQSTMTFWQEIGRCGRDGRQCTSITYPYPRSLSLCPEKEFKNIITGDSCYRHSILSLFVLNGMSQEIQKPAKCTDNACEECQCEMCRCCSNCWNKCSCSGKLETRI